MTADDGSDRDRGSGTIWMLIVVLLTSALVALVLVRATVVSVRHRVASGADLAALAGAQAFAAGATRDQACLRAQAVATASDLLLRACRIDGRGAISVLARAIRRFPLIGEQTAQVWARAGPVSPESSGAPTTP